MNITFKHMMMAGAAFIGLWMLFGTIKFVVRKCRSHSMTIPVYHANDLGLDLTTTDTFRSVIHS